MLWKVNAAGWIEMEVREERKLLFSLQKTSWWYIERIFLGDHQLSIFGRNGEIRS